VVGWKEVCFDGGLFEVVPVYGCHVPLGVTHRTYLVVFSGLVVIRGGESAVLVS
jgi:hypothetical protein